MLVGDGGPVRLQTAPVPSRPGHTVTMTNPQKALNWALTNADVDAILDVLSSGEVDVDERDRACGMQTVLMRLCHLRITEDERCLILRVILRNDPDVNVKDTSGRTALTHACIAEKTDIIEYLSDLPHCDPAVKDNDGNTPLMHAVRSRRVHIVDALLRCFYDRLDINAKNNKGATAYAEAESRQDVDICRVLVSEGGAVPFPSYPVPASARQTPRSSVSDLHLPTSPNLPSRSSSTPRRRLEALPPTVLSGRPRAPPEALLSPRTVRKSATFPSSSLLSDNLSDTSSTVLLSLPEERHGSHTMPRKNARKKESASEFGGQYSSRVHQQGKVRRNAPNSQHLPNIDDGHGKVNGSRQPAEDLHSVPRVNRASSSREPSPLSLPKLPEDFTDREATDGGEKPPRRRRKNSASLPNLTNTGSAFLVSAQTGHSNSSDNIAAAAESRALDWERGVRTSYRRDQDFKLPQLTPHMTLGGGLTTSDWCKRCGQVGSLCGCRESESRLESSRLSSKAKSRSSGKAIERMFYLSGERVPVRSSRTFTSGD